MVVEAYLDMQSRLARDVRGDISERLDICECASLVRSERMGSGVCASAVHG